MSDLIELHQGDAIDVMASLPDQSVDAVITDPPYALDFMGQRWDSWQSAAAFQSWCFEWAEQCYRLLKPGGHLISFGGARTWHRLACAVEDARFEIRDSIAWLHSNGYPKSPDLLKPAHEPIVVARRPFAGTLHSNRELHGTGAMDIAAVRETRWPTNVALDDTVAADLDQQTGILSSGVFGPQHADRGKKAGIYGAMTGRKLTKQFGGDSGGGSRFYPVFKYHAKATKAERPHVEGVTHLAVKPLGLIRWLVKLSGAGVVLDPFVGSGTTAEACILEEVRCIAIERETAYLPLIHARIERATAPAQRSSPPVSPERSPQASVSV